MMKVININGRGTLTLPKLLRQRLGLKSAGQVVAEETREGILLRSRMRTFSLLARDCTAGCALFWKG
jgi:bifunctional DNA-binding transcriptional regulator/antitoxin component of YhaV-PrlF toxin-antitoxin module